MHLALDILFCNISLFPKTFAFPKNMDFSFLTSCRSLHRIVKNADFSIHILSMLGSFSVQVTIKYSDGMTFSSITYYCMWYSILFLLLCNCCLHDLYKGRKLVPHLLYIPRASLSIHSCLVSFNLHLQVLSRSLNINGPGLVDLNLFRKQIIYTISYNEMDFHETFIKKCLHNPI